MAIAVVAMLVVGCGGDAGPRAADPTSPTGTSPTSRRADPESPGHDPAPTRLVAGPVLMRLTGTPAPTRTDGSPQVRYILIFRLDRGYTSVRNGRSYGAFLIAGGGLDPFPFGRRGSHCFGAVVDGRGSDQPEVARRLDAVERGTRVRVEIQPLTVKDGKNTQIAEPYVRRPRMRVSGVLGDIPDYRRAAGFTNPTARAAIRRLGCA